MIFWFSHIIFWDPIGGHWVLVLLYGILFLIWIDLYQSLQHAYGAIYFVCFQIFFVEV